MTAAARTLSASDHARLLADVCACANATGTSAGPADRLLTTDEAAALLGLSPRTLERRRTARKPVLPHIEVVPGRVRYRLQDVLKHLDKARQPARSDG